MRKRARKITVIADDYKIISSEKHSGERVNWRKEAQIRNKISRDNSGLSFYKEKNEFEDRLHMECGLLETVKFDPWTNEMHLYSFQVWYIYRLKVGYTYENQSYESQVEYETDLGRLPDECTLEITFCKDNPQQVLSVSVHQESIWEHLVCRIRQFLCRDK